MTVEIEGRCDRRFGKVKDTFAENFRTRGEHGSSVSVTVDGEPVVDLWAGWTGPAEAFRWQPDTLVCVQSVTKQVLTLALHMLVDRGLVALDAPVARYWPEFAQAGKAALKVQWLLDHRAGLPVVSNAWPGLAYDWQAMSQALARTSPMWEPGTTPCYHAATYGYLVGEVLRRVTGRMPSAFIREEICTPLGIEFCIGLKPDEERRTATFQGDTNKVAARWLQDPESLFAKAWNVFDPKDDYNSLVWRHSEIPSAGGHTNARSLARLCGTIACGGTLDGVRLISPAALARAGELQWQGTDVAGRYYAMGLGFVLPSSNFPATGAHVLGMHGAGGATAFADFNRRLGFGYTTSVMDPNLYQEARRYALVASLNASLR